MSTRHHQTAQVAVVIPVYNAERWLEATLQSVSAQSFKDLHVIVVNDGSTDQSPRILTKLQASLPIRMTILHQENSGVASARNAGIRAANEEFVAFMDADDLWHVNKLELQVEHLRTHRDTIAVSCGYMIEKNYPFGSRKVVKFDWTEQSLRRWLLFLGHGALLSSTLIVRRLSLSQTGLFDENLGTTADLAFALRLRATGNCDLVPRTLALYRQHESQMHRSLQALEKDYQYLLRQREYVESIDVSAAQADMNYLSYVALHQLVNRQFALALKNAGAIAQTSPQTLLKVWSATALRRLR